MMCTCNLGIYRISWRLGKVQLELKIHFIDSELVLSAQFPLMFPPNSFTMTKSLKMTKVILCYPQFNIIIWSNMVQPIDQKNKNWSAKSHRRKDRHSASPSCAAAPRQLAPATWKNQLTAEHAERAPWVPTCSNCPEEIPFIWGRVSTKKWPSGNLTIFNIY